MNIAAIRQRSPKVASTVPRSHERQPLPAISRQSHTAPTVARCACGGSCPRCKEERDHGRTLTINQPGDEYEQEADRVAEQVMRMPNPQTTDQPMVPRQTQSVQCMYRGCGEKLHHQLVEEDEEETLPAKEVRSRTPEVKSDVEAQINALRGGGRPLPESERTFFEPRLGSDFSQVRIHTDSRAAQSARAIHALAYTIGHDIVFGASQYVP